MTSKLAGAFLVLPFQRNFKHEIQLHTVTWSCQTLQTVVKPVKCNVTLLAKQLNCEEHASLINTCISVKNVTLNAHVNSYIFSK